MAKYTLKSYCNTRLLEVFDARTPAKMNHILADERMNQPNLTDGWGEPIETANRFEIYDALRRLIFTGSVDEARPFVRKLR